VSETVCYQRKPVSDGPFFQGWQTKYVEWPWWAHVLLIFKSAEWVGCDGVEYKVKRLFGSWYLLGVRMKKWRNT